MSNAPLVRVRTFVRDVLNRKGDTAPLTDDSSLIESARLDSFAVVEIIAFLEAEFGVDFTARIFEVDDFESVRSIASLIGQ